MSKKQAITVLCVDDHPDVCLMLATAINTQADMKCVGTLHDACEFIKEAERLRPDIVLLDLTMPGTNPLQALRQLRESQPDVKTIVFSGYDDEQTVNDAIDAGAWGFLSKHQEMDKIFATIRQVAHGEFAMQRK